MNRSYQRGAIMTQLMRELEVRRNYTTGKKLWRVNFGGELIGYIETGISLNNRYKYTAFSSMFNQYEYDSSRNFMKTLSMFISPAIDAIERQGEKESEYIGKVGVFNYSNTYFVVEKAMYDPMDRVDSYVLQLESAPGVLPRYCVIPSFDLRFQMLMGLATIA